jgi:glycosyltransferase involved in cell wall biosynthesis
VPTCLLAFEPPDGGVAEHVLQLGLGLSAHGWEPRVAGPPQSSIDEALDEAGIPRVRLPLERGYGRPWRDAGALRGLLGLLRGGDVDLLHAHSAKAGALGRIAATATSTPSVYTPHAFAFLRPQPVTRVVAATLERALGAATGAIVCVAEQERRLALERRIARPDRLRVVRNGCAPCQEDLAPDPELEAFAAGGPLAACLTVLRPQKAVHVFVDAAAAVIARIPDARLAVIGNGELRGELERRADRLGLGERLGFFDFHPPSARQLRSVDVFVLPSAWEALPISILEALACGVPQVVTDVGGNPEAVRDGETGLVVPPHDPTALAQAVVALLVDPDRRATMASRSKQRWAQEFQLPVMVERTVAVYDEVLGSSRPAGKGSTSKPAGPIPHQN